MSYLLEMKEANFVFQVNFSKFNVQSKHHNSNFRALKIKAVNYLIYECCLLYSIKMFYHI